MATANTPISCYIRPGDATVTLMPHLTIEQCVNGAVCYDDVFVRRGCVSVRERVREVFRDDVASFL